MMHNAYIGIGTNIEPRTERIKKAFKSLEQFGTLEKKSSIYETAPYGFTKQADFLNAAVKLRTELKVEQLHEALRLSEKALGRTERLRWHEREIDFDILFYDDVVMNSENLTIPHPELPYRAFVLVPMNEIAPDLIHPVIKKNIASLLQELEYDKESIKIIHGSRDDF